MRGRIKFVIAGVMVALVASAGAAGAVVGDEPDDDQSVFNYGYDMANRMLVFGLSAATSAYDCTLEGSFEVGYAEGEGEDRSVESLTGEDGEPVEFDARDGEELPEGVTPADGPIAFDASDNPCILTAVDVTGPNGQVNHGQIVSSFSHAIDVAGKGCVMRWIAKTGWGKGDTQVQSGDVDTAAAPPETGTLDIMSVLANCKHLEGATVATDGDEETSDHPGNGKKPEKNKDKGKPESPGNSANAPGKNK